jgi:signal transduction histidine kinase
VEGAEDVVTRGSGLVLGEVDFDRLLREVLGRVHGVRDEPDRQRHLLEAVVGEAWDLPLDAVLSRILSAASNLVDARYAALGVLTEGPECRLRTFVHLGMGDELATRIGDLPSGRGLLGLLIEDPRPLRLPDVAAHPSSYGFPEHHPAMTSFLGVPITVHGRALGSLFLTDKSGSTDFTETDEAVVVALAGVAGVAIENANRRESAAQRQAWLTATAEITALLVDDTSEEPALQVVADRARSVAGADVSWVVTGSDPHHLHLEVVSGAPLDLEAMRALPMKESLASIVVRTGEAIAVRDVASDPRAVDPSSLEGWPRLGPVVVLPLRSDRGVEGALSLAWKPENSDGYLRLDPALPASFAEHAALAVHVARSRDERQRLTLYEDRDRIGRDLHDLVIQRLFGVGLSLQSASNLSQAEEFSARLEQAIDEIDGTIKDIRRAIFALGSLDTATDVQSQIEDLVERIGSTMKLRPQLLIEGPVRTAVAPELAPDLVAVLSEALTNVSRHAEASRVEVEVTVTADSVEVRVSDDGRGMGEDVVESGLDNMRARAQKHGGDLVVESERGAGTTVVWRAHLD